MRCALATLTLILFPMLAQGGAWMREPGKTFLSVSAAEDIGSGGGLRFDDSVSVFIDHGVSSGLTIGVSGWAAGGATEIIGFASTPFWTNGDDNWALLLGLGGYRNGANPVQPSLRLAASWGRGFDESYGSGWMQAETSVTQRFRPGLTILKLDLTLGLNHGDRGKAMLQFFAEKEGALAASGKIKPSYVLKLNDRTELVISGTFGVVASGTRQISIGTWMSF